MEYSAKHSRQYISSKLIPYGMTHDVCGCKPFIWCMFVVSIRVYVVLSIKNLHCPSESVCQLFSRFSLILTWFFPSDIWCKTSTHQCKFAYMLASRAACPVHRTSQCRNQVYILQTIGQILWTIFYILSDFISSWKL